MPLRGTKGTGDTLHSILCNALRRLLLLLLWLHCVLGVRGTWVRVTCVRAHWGIPPPQAHSSRAGCAAWRCSRGRGLADVKPRVRSCQV